ncbi:MAG: desulfoferrodoxin family protein [Slackia sp.]|nr:desulfoferrodoxin family protein [Slackia sp.]
MDIKFFKCEHCGNIAIKIVEAGVPLVCCGEKMVELVAGSVDAAVEKHVPVVSVDGAQVHVTVGEVEHPMTEAHLIQFIVLVTEKGYQIAQLDAEDAPQARFVVAEGDKAVKVYEYCNLHGLWVKEL